MNHRPSQQSKDEIEMIINQFRNQEPSIAKRMDQEIEQIKLPISLQHLPTIKKTWSIRLSEWISTPIQPPRLLDFLLLRFSGLASSILLSLPIPILLLYLYLGRG